MTAWLLPAACMLGCPLMMGAMMLLVGRDHGEAKLERELRRLERRSYRTRTGDGSVGLTQAHLLRRLWCTACINWRVALGMVLLAALVGIIRPGLFLAVAPVLLVLLCPLSMLLAMRGRVGTTPRLGPHGADRPLGTQTEVGTSPRASAGPRTPAPTDQR